MSRDRVERPYVAVDRTYVAVVLYTARRHVFFVSYDRGIRVVKRGREEFEAVYHPLLVKEDSDGRKTPTPKEQGGQPYDIQVAARKYLNWGSRAGITEVAERALNKIIEGEYDMSNVEQQSATQGELKLPAAKALGDALQDAVKPKKSKANGKSAEAKAKEQIMKPTKASTKNGTTKEAKKPGKPTVTKENKETTAKPGKEKPAPKKPKKEASAASSGRPTSFDSSKTIKVLVEGNPRREGSKGHENWAITKRYDGKTVEGYLKAGGGTDHLRWDISHKNIKLV